MSDKQKSLDLALKQIEKAFGKGSIMRMGDKDILDIEAISTGSIGLDKALGIGGIPKGRIVEIYGPESSSKTTTALHIAAETQKKGGTVAFIDAEHALDPKYAKNIGVDVDNLLLSQPDGGGEEALDIVETLVRSGAVDLIIVDSVAALTPKSELEGEMSDQNVGVQARMMSKALRKLTGIVHKMNCTVIFINQIRMKIGMMGYGCFHYDTLVNFTDGKSIPIGKVVDENIKGNVFCLNEETNTIEEKEIIDWHDNGKVENNNDFIHIQTASINGHGRFGFTCTPNHEILTENGWKEAKDISYEDKLISKYSEKVNGTLKDFLYGTFCGDSSLKVRSNNTACLVFQDNQNKDYLNWKIDKLVPFFNFKEVLSNPKLNLYRYSTEYNYEFSKIKKSFKNRSPLEMLKNRNFMSLALWIMDDGIYDSHDYHSRYKISIGRLNNNMVKLNEVKDELISFLNIKEQDINIELNSGSLLFSAQASRIIAKNICKYIPKCMEYKLPDEFKGRYIDFNLENNEVIKTDTVNIKEIRIASPRQMRNKRKFDISVKDNHNYMVGGVNNGIVVHNSPETTTGGNALKFYASVRIDVRRVSTLKSGDDNIGIRVKAKVIKNKVAAPFAQAEYEVMFGQGISQIGEIIEYGVKYDIIDKAGSWFSYGETKLGQGKEKVKEALEANPDLFFEIKEKVQEKLVPAIATDIVDEE